MKRWHANEIESRKKTSSIAMKRQNRCFSQGNGHPATNKGSHDEEEWNEVI